MRMYWRKLSFLTKTICISILENIVLVHYGAYAKKESKIGASFYCYLLCPLNKRTVFFFLFWDNPKCSFFQFNSQKYDKRALKCFLTKNVQKWRLSFVSQKLHRYYWNCKADSKKQTFIRLQKKMACYRSRNSKKI